MFIIDIITSPSQLQTTTHDMSLSVFQQQVTTITASTLISTEYQNRQDRKPASNEGILYSIRGLCA